MKQELFINQLNYFISDTKSKIENLFRDKDREEKERHYTHIGFHNAFNRLNGMLNSLENIDKKEPIETQIINYLRIYEDKSKKLKVNYLDSLDENFPQFYDICGASTILMILLTITDNPQSCCPLNKDILLKKTLLELEDKYQKCLINKDKKTSTETKIELGIINKLYQENLKFL
jgi:hypothetical protein